MSSDTDKRTQRRTIPLEHLPALLGLVLFSAFLLAAFGRMSGKPFETDLTALLPERLTESADPATEKLVRDRLTREEGNRITLLVEVPGEPRWTETARRTLRSALLASGPARTDTAGTVRLSELRLTQAAGKLLTDEDRAFLKSAPTEALEARFLATLTNPAQPKLLGTARDPLGLYDAWTMRLSERLPVRPEERTAADGTTEEALVLRGRTDASVLLFRIPDGVAETGEGSLRHALTAAEDAARNALPEALRPTLRVSAAGLALFTDAAATRMRSELSLIGTLSTLGVLLFGLAFFGRAATVLVLAGTVALAFLAGFSAVGAAFGTPALVTLVFGTTLIGVAVDYGGHWFAAAAGEPDPRVRRRRLARNLLPAAISSALAYGVLILTPLPGLRQMGTLAAAGILSAALFVLLWLPYAERWAPKRDTALLRRLVRDLPRLPRWSRLRPSVRLGLTLSAALFLGFGLLRTEWSSGVRDLNAVPPELVSAQAHLTEALRLPSPAQVFVVSGQTPDELLGREIRLLEALRETLPHVRPDALAALLPTTGQQSADRALVEAAHARIRPAMTELLGAGALPTEAAPLTAEDLIRTPFGRLVEPLRLTDTTHLVTLSGVGPDDLPALERLHDPASGVRFLNLTEGIAQALTLYRDRILGALALGLTLLAAALLPLLGRNVWRALLPTAFGMAAALAAFGWLGLPVTLFSALGLTLVLGLGVDYGIFMSRNPDDGRTAAALLFSGVTTMLSFALLGFSSTPALSAFGLAVFFGMAGVWTATPLLRPDVGQ